MHTHSCKVLWCPRIVTILLVPWPTLHVSATPLLTCIGIYRHGPEIPAKSFNWINFEVYGAFEVNNRSLVGWLVQFPSLSRCFDGRGGRIPPILPFLPVGQWGVVSMETNGLPLTLSVKLLVWHNAPYIRDHTGHYASESAQASTHFSISWYSTKIYTEMLAWPWFIGPDNY